MSKYIIGIDGGGTKTLGVLWNRSGEELKRIEKGFSNFNVDIKKAKDNLEETIKELTPNKTEAPIIIIGASGYSGLKNPKEYELELSNKFNAKVLLKDDGFLALNSVENINKLPVVLVISGTGSIVYGLIDNEYYRYGGHGHLLGDEGSSYDVAIKAFRHVTNDFDNNKFSDFTKKFSKEANIENSLDIKQIVYHNPKNVIASYSKVVDKLANENDQEALTIIEQSAIDLGHQIIMLLNKMNVKDKFILALRGGLLTNSKIFREKVLCYLNQNNKLYIIDEKNNEPVYGAYNVGEEMKNE